MNTKSFEALDGFVFVPVWIANSVTKNVGRKDIRELHAMITGEGDFRTAIINETYRDLDRMRFYPAAGCELRDGSGRYECISVDSLQAGKKIHPRLELKRIAA